MTTGRRGTVHYLLFYDVVADYEKKREAHRALHLAHARRAVARGELVLGGALGNLIDRIRLGEVVDFISFHYKAFHWPAFNVADIGITTGVFLLVLRIFFFDKRQPVRRDPPRRGRLPQEN